MRIVLTLALALTATAAQAQTTRLSQGHVVCRNLEQAVTTMNTTPVQAATNLAMRLIQSGECIVLPQGEAVKVQYRDGRFSCVSPVTGGQCGWTMLMSRR